MKTKISRVVLAAIVFAGVYATANTDWLATDSTHDIVAGANTRIAGSITAGTLGTSFHQLNGSLIDSQAIGTTVASASGANFRAADTTSMAQGVGGAVVFRGNYTGTTPTHGASIKLMKSSATDSETAFDLVFATRPAGGSAELEALRIKSDQSASFVGAVTANGTVTVAGAGTMVVNPAAQSTTFTAMDVVQTAGTYTQNGVGGFSAGGGTANSGLTVSGAGHLRSNGLGAALACNGTGGVSCVAAACTDISGTITTNTGATSCTVTFQMTYTVAPVCVVSSGTALSAPVGYSRTATVLTITFPIASGDNIDYICIGGS